MEFNRLPRFRRAEGVISIELTHRDREIIRLIHRHRYLRSSQVTALLTGSDQQILRRLQLLYHHGYLERPHIQLDYFHHGGSRHIVYGLGNKGWRLVRRKLGRDFHDLSWGDKNRSVGRIFLEHALLVSDIMVAIELACRQRGLHLLSERELARSDKRKRTQLFRWKVKVNGGLKLSVVPDRVFALEFTDQTGKTDRILFFLEADRGTMPVIRKNFGQTSFFRKLLAYEATWLQGVHRRRFGFNRFRVLTVTTIAGRVQSLIEACSKLKRGHGLFLFADKTVLNQHEDILSRGWRGCRGDSLCSPLV